MTPRCTLTATLHARPEKREELVALLAGFVEPSRSEPGCVEYHFHVSADDPNVFYFYENWVTRADLDRHLELPYQKNWFARHDEFLTQAAELKFYDMLSEYAAS
jgi:quinol monooxygenase YgiN